MATTPYLALFKPDGTSAVDPVADISNAMDIIDSYAQNHNHDGSGIHGSQLTKASLSDAGAVNGIALLDANGNVTEPPAQHGGSRHLIHYVQKKIAGAGNYVFNKASNTTWYEVDATNLRATLNAAVGDLIQVKMHGEWFNEPVAAEMDVASVVSGSPVNWWGASGGTGDFGIPSLIAPSGVIMPFACAISKVLVSGDISGGAVTCSPFVRVNTVGSNKTLFSIAAVPLFFSIENKGQVIAP